jgi:hypothetical protein
MTTTKIFKSKITIPILISLTVAILIVPAMPSAFASHVFVITPSSTQIGPVGTSQTFNVNIQNLGGDGFNVGTLQGCPAPATDRVGPFLSVSSDPPSTTEVHINSDTPGTFDCAYNVISQSGRFPPHTSTIRVTAIFQPLPPPVMCGPGTILDQNNKCIPDPDEVIMCGPGTILDQNNKCVPDFANICGPGTILNDDNQCVPEPKKVDVCHKGKKTINISSNAVPAHLAHGDTLGQCS